jgi:hypothetical protein
MGECGAAARHCPREDRECDPQLAMRSHWFSITMMVVGGCYHYEFVQWAPAPGQTLVTYRERRPTWLNGLVGTGAVDTGRYCARPVRTELRVEAIDVVLSIATLLIYTPHTRTWRAPAIRRPIAPPGARGTSAVVRATRALGRQPRGGWIQRGRLMDPARA